nr:ORF2 [Bat astrovirus]
MPHKGKCDAKSSDKKVEVKVEVKPDKQHPKKHKQKQTKGQGKAGAIAKAVAKDVKKIGLEGPKPRQTIRVSATIGFVNGSSQEGPVLAVSANLHPSLAKEPEGGSAFGPLAAAASQFGQWRLSGIVVRLTPLVGSSAAAGTVARLSINTTGGAVPVTWGGLGARHHRDVAIGDFCSWKIDRGVLSGPRQTWWLTDTNETGNQSAGPSLEIHTLGVTSSTYQNSGWDKPLFMVELQGTWQFTTYSNQPGMGVLERAEATDNVTFSKDSTTGALSMSLTPTSQLAQFMGFQSERSSHLASSPRVGETVWKIVDVGAKAAASVAPPPFGWLIRGGLWFAKRVLGGPSDATANYLVYGSLDEALTNAPIMPDSVTASAIQNMRIQTTQMNNPNIGPISSAPSVSSSAPVVPSQCDNFLVVGASRVLYEMKQTTGNVYKNLGNSLIPWNKTSNKTLMLVKQPNQQTFRIQLMGGYIFENAGTGAATPPEVFGYLGDTFLGRIELSSLPPSGLVVQNLDGNPFGEVLLCKSELFDGRASSLSLTVVLFKVTAAQPATGLNPSTDWLIKVPSTLSPGATVASWDFNKLTLNSLGDVRLEAKEMQVGRYVLAYAIGDFAIGGPDIVPPSKTYGSTGPSEFLVNNPFSENNTLPWQEFISLARPRATHFSVRLLKPKLATNPVDDIVQQVLQQLAGGPSVESESEDEDDESLTSDLEVISSPTAAPDCQQPVAPIDAGGLSSELAARIVSALWSSGQNPGFSPPN